MYMPYFPPHPVKLRTHRRSRCWKCDNRMAKRTRQSWWCRHCVHLVTYGWAIRKAWIDA